MEPGGEMDTSQTDHVTTFARDHRDWKSFNAAVEDLLRRLLSEAEITPQAIESRVKTVDSFREKSSRSSKSYNDPLAEITDLSGHRLILYFADDIDRVVGLIRSEFSVDESNSVDKSTLLAPDQVGYKSVHLIIRLSDERAKLTEYLRWKDRPAEVQIRTVLQHAWAAIEHGMQYKASGDVPSEFRRRLYLAAGSLELVDEHFIRLRKEKRMMEAEAADDDKDVPINAVTLRAWLTCTPWVHTAILDVAEKYLPTSTARLDDEMLGQAANLLLAAGIQTTSSLSTHLEKAEQTIPKFFAALAKEFQSRGLYDLEVDTMEQLYLAMQHAIRSTPHGVKTPWNDDYRDAIEAALALAGDGTSPRPVTA